MGLSNYLCLSVALSVCLSLSLSLSIYLSLYGSCTVNWGPGSTFSCTMNCTAPSCTTSSSTLSSVILPFFGSLISLCLSCGCVVCMSSFPIGALETFMFYLTILYVFMNKRDRKRKRKKDKNWSIAKISREWGGGKSPHRYEDR